MSLTSFPWALLIAAFILLLALFIKHVLAGVLENTHAFLGVVGVFLALYVVAAIAVGSLDPLRLLSSQANAASDTLSQDATFP